MSDNLIFSKVGLLLLFVAVLRVPLEDPTARLECVIIDQQGAAIRGAYILLHRDVSGAGVGVGNNAGFRRDLTLEAGESGHVATQLSPGFYDVFVSADAFTPDCRKVLIGPGESAIYKATLRPDPLVTKQLGDSFSKR